MKKLISSIILLSFTIRSAGVDSLVIPAQAGIHSHTLRPIATACVDTYVKLPQVAGKGRAAKSADARKSSIVFPEFSAKTSSAGKSPIQTPDASSTISLPFGRYLKEGEINSVLAFIDMARRKISDRQKIISMLIKENFYMRVYSIKNNLILCFKEESGEWHYVRFEGARSAVLSPAQITDFSNFAAYAHRYDLLESAFGSGLEDIFLAEEESEDFEKRTLIFEFLNREDFEERFVIFNEYVGDLEVSQALFLANASLPKERKLYFDTLVSYGIDPADAYEQAMEAAEDKLSEHEDLESEDLEGDDLRYEDFKGKPVPLAKATKTSSLEDLKKKMTRGNLFGAILIYIRNPAKDKLVYLRDACQSDPSVREEILDELKGYIKLMQEILGEILMPDSRRYEIVETNLERAASLYSSIQKTKDSPEKKERGQQAVPTLPTGQADDRQASPELLGEIVRSGKVYVRGASDIPKGWYEKTSLADGTLIHFQWRVLKKLHRISEKHSKNTLVRFSFTSVKLLLDKLPYVKHLLPAEILSAQDQLVLAAKEKGKETVYYLVCPQNPYLRRLQTGPRAFIGWLAREARYNGPEVVSFISGLSLDLRPRYTMRGSRQHNHDSWSGPGNKDNDVITYALSKSAIVKYSLWTTAEIKQKIPISSNIFGEEAQLVLAAETKKTTEYYLFNQTPSHAKLVLRLFKDTGEIELAHGMKTGHKKEIADFLLARDFTDRNKPPMSVDKFMTRTEGMGRIDFGAYKGKDKDSSRTILAAVNYKTEAGIEVELKRQFLENPPAGMVPQWILKATILKTGQVYYFMFPKDAYVLSRINLSPEGYISAFAANGIFDDKNIRPFPPDINSFSMDMPKSRLFNAAAFTRGKRTHVSGSLKGLGKAEKITFTVEFRDDIPRGFKPQWLFKVTGLSKEVFFRFTRKGNHLSQVDIDPVTGQEEVADYLRKGFFNDPARPPFSVESFSAETIKGGSIYFGRWKDGKRLYDFEIKFQYLPEGHRVLIRKEWNEADKEWRLLVDTNDSNYQTVIYRFTPRRTLVQVRQKNQKNRFLRSTQIAARERQHKIAELVKASGENKLTTCQIAEALGIKVSIVNQDLKGALADPKDRIERGKQAVPTLPTGQAGGRQAPASPDRGSTNPADNASAVPMGESGENNQALRENSELAASSGDFIILRRQIAEKFGSRVLYKDLLERLRQAKSIGERVDILLREDGLSITELAQKFGIDRETVARWIRNKTNLIYPKFIFKLSEIFRIDACLILEGRSLWEILTDPERNMGKGIEALRVSAGKETKDFAEYGITPSQFSTWKKAIFDEVTPLTLKRFCRFIGWKDPVMVLRGRPILEALVNAQQDMLLRAQKREESGVLSDPQLVKRHKLAIREDIELLKAAERGDTEYLQNAACRERIRLLVMDKGKADKEIAKEMGVYRSYVTYWLNGRYLEWKGTHEKISRYFNLSEQLIFEGLPTEEDRKALEREEFVKVGLVDRAAASPSAAKVTATMLIGTLARDLAKERDLASEETITADLKVLKTPQAAPLAAKPAHEAFDHAA